MSQNVPLREDHPVQSILAHMKKQSIFYSKQVQLLQKGKNFLVKYICHRHYFLVTEEKRILTPYANEYLEGIKGDATMYTVEVIKEDEYTVWRATDNHNPHLVNWSSRSCSNCHFYAENLMPCVHLYAIWINHKAAGLPTKNKFGKLIKITKNDAAYEHLFGKCYLVSTLQESLNNLSNAVPISMESISIDENVPDLALQQKPVKGRTQKKRKASNIDRFQTGNKSAKGVKKDTAVMESEPI